MILKHYYDLAQALREALPELAWIDLDKGQFESPEAFNTVLLPGVLLQFSPVDWSTFGQRTQQGTGTVTLKLAVYLPAQTHESEPLFASNLDAFTLAGVLNRAVQTLDWVHPRTTSREYPVRTWHVIEQTYEVVLTPDPPNYRRLTLPVVIHPQLVKPPVP